MTEFVQVGFNNYVAINRVLSISPMKHTNSRGRRTAPSAPIARMAREGQSRGEVIDATMGRAQKTIILLDNGYVVLSALSPETIVGRNNQHKPVKPESPEKTASAVEHLFKKLESEHMIIHKTDGTLTKPWQKFKSRYL